MPHFGHCRGACSEHDHAAFAVCDRAGIRDGQQLAHGNFTIQQDQPAVSMTTTVEVSSSHHNLSSITGETGIGRVNQIRRLRRSVAYAVMKPLAKKKLSCRGRRSFCCRWWER